MSTAGCIRLPRYSTVAGTVAAIAVIMMMMSTHAFATIDDLEELAGVTGGYNWKETGKAALGGAVAGVTSGAVGGAMTGGLAGAGIGAGVGGVSGAIGSAVYDAGYQLHFW